MHDVLLPKINILLNFALLMTKFALLLLLPTGSTVLLLPTVTDITRCYNFNSQDKAQYTS